MRRHLLLLLALLLLAATCPSHLEARSLTIESFDADIVVNPDGTVEVTETIRPRFIGTWNGIYRTIPIEYRTPQGMNYTLFLNLQASPTTPALPSNTNRAASAITASSRSGFPAPPMLPRRSSSATKHRTA